MTITPETLKDDSDSISGFYSCNEPESVYSSTKEPVWLSAARRYESLLHSCKNSSIIDSVSIHSTPRSTRARSVKHKKNHIKPSPLLVETFQKHEITATGKCNKQNKKKIISAVAVNTNISPCSVPKIIVEPRGTEDKKNIETYSILEKALDTCRNIETIRTSGTEALQNSMVNKHFIQFRNTSFCSPNQKPDVSIKLTREKVKNRRHGNIPNSLVKNGTHHNGRCRSKFKKTSQKKLSNAERETFFK
jgi:hypothetical protein